MKCFMTPAIAKLTAKKIHRSHATLSICHIGCSPLETPHCTQIIIMALNRKASAYKKKSCGFMVSRYVMFIASTFKFWLLFSIRKFYLILYNISMEVKYLTFSDNVSRETLLLGGLGKWG